MAKNVMTSLPKTYRVAYTSSRKERIYPVFTFTDNDIGTVISERALKDKTYHAHYRPQPQTAEIQAIERLCGVGFREGHREKKYSGYANNIRIKMTVICNGEIVHTFSLAEIQMSY